VLDIHGREHVDSSIEEVDHVLISLAVFAAFHVGVGEFVNNRYRRFARDDGVNIHLLEESPFVFESTPWQARQLRYKFANGLSSMCFNNADNDIFSTAVSPNRLAEHAVGLADSWSVAEKEFEQRLLLWRRFFQPLLWRLGSHGTIVNEWRSNAATFIQFLCLFMAVEANAEVIVE
jgi:hypothetical protein